MSKTYGRVDLVEGKWKIVAQPHVMLRIKRVFERIYKGSHGHVLLSDTPENSRELLWFIERYPMEVENLGYLQERADEHRNREKAIEEIVSESYKPTEFKMSMPPRSYQAVAADIVMKTGRLLLADDVGLGKTCAAICTLTDPRTLPALVVTLTHLPKQWVAEIGKFAPDLRCHVIKKGKPYPIGLSAGKGERFPDVLIVNYHKLTGWADTLAPLIKSVVFDEIQELRHDGSLKYTAARHLTESVQFKMGLSATPIYNYGGEIYNVVDVLSPDALGARDEFMREWCIAEGEKPKVSDPRAFGIYLRDQGIMLRRTREEVGRELPPLSKVPHCIEADLNELEKIGKSAAELSWIILAQQGTKRGEKLRASEELSFLLRQATGIAKAPFVAEFVRLLVDSGEKVVLYGWHREVYSIWADKLEDLKPAFYTGAESPTQKEEARRRFLSGETPVLIMSLRAGAGLDGLQGTSRIVVFGELDWSPGVHTQCIGRVYRDGQKDSVTAYFLISDHGSDPVVSDVLDLKRQQIGGIVDPNAALIEASTISEGNIKRLAESYLKQRGLRAPAPESSPIPQLYLVKPPPTEDNNPPEA